MIATKYATLVFTVLTSVVLAGMSGKSSYVDLGDIKSCGSCPAAAPTCASTCPTGKCKVIERTCYSCPIAICEVSDFKMPMSTESQQAMFRTEYRHLYGAIKGVCPQLIKS